MSAISDYGTAVDAAFDKIDTGLTSLAASQLGIADDVTYIKEELAKLQNNPGPITPEDQAILDRLIARASALSTKTEATATALAELDAATARPVPPAA